MKEKNKFNLSLITLFGIALTIFPFQLSEKISVIKINQPSYSEEFGTVFPVVSILSIASFIFFFVKLISNNDIYIKFKYIYIYIIINILSIIFALYITPDFFLDSAILLINSLSVVLIWSLIDKDNRYIWIILSIFISCSIAIFAQITGLYYEDRINIPGFEVTSTGYVAALMILLSLEFIPIRFRILIIITGLYVIISTGSRFPLLLLIFVLALRFISKEQILIKILYIICIFSLLILSFNILLGTRDDFNNYSIPMLIDDFIQAIGSYDANLPEQNEKLSMINTIFGRTIGIMSGIDLIKLNFPNPLGSDWIIQEGLIDRGFPSHTHSTLLQYILKYGVFSIVIFYFTIKNYINQIKFSDNKRWAYLYLILSALIDYIFFVPSLVAIFLLLSSEDKKKNSPHE